MTGFEDGFSPNHQRRNEETTPSLCCCRRRPKSGIEFSAELNDLISEDMAKIYPDLMQYYKITVYDVAEKVLSMFDDKLAKYAIERFTREGMT